MRVLDDGANDVATATTLENDTVTVALAAGLADGTYTVVWEVVSVDSHRISGASVFHVGAPSSQGLTADQLDLGGDDAGWGVRAGAAILTAIAYAGALVAAGTLCFSLYADSSERLLDVSSKAAVLGAVALVAATPFRIARLGGGLDALRDNDVLTAALRGPIGVSTAVTALALLVAAVLTDRGRAALGADGVHHRRPRWLRHRGAHPHAGAAVVARGVGRRPSRRRRGVARRPRRPRPRLPRDRAMPARSPGWSAASATSPSSPSASSP